jgi:cholesterol transport system auxiliary component
VDYYDYYPKASIRSRFAPMIDRGQQAKKGAGAPDRILGLLTLAVLLGGCAGLQPSPVDVPNLHVLGSKPLARAAQPKRDFVLEVSMPRSWPGFDTSQMAYVQRPYELDYFAANRWADTPARMLDPLLAQALEQSGSFKAVVHSPSPVPPDIRFNSELVRLQQDFTTRPSRVEFTLQLQLIDVRGKRVIATKLLDEVENAPTDDAYGGVTAANLALQRILQQAVDFCIEQSSYR